MVKFSTTAQVALLAGCKNFDKNKRILLPAEAQFLVTYSHIGNQALFGLIPKCFEAVNHRFSAFSYIQRDLFQKEHTREVSGRP
jgi:hypothetical protein